VTAAPGKDCGLQPEPTALLAAVHAVLPLADRPSFGPFLLRIDPATGAMIATAGPGRPGPDAQAAIAAAAARMAGAGQPPRFGLGETDSDRDTDAALARAGYRIESTGLVHVAPIGRLHQGPPPPLSGFAAWPPLAIQHQIWAEAGPGTAGRSVAAGMGEPCTSILGRIGHRAAGTLLVACRGDVAVLHGLVVRSEHRRGGLARRMVAAAAHWAAGQGALWIVAALAEDDRTGLSLAESLSMTPAARFHHRVAG